MDVRISKSQIAGGGRGLFAKKGFNPGDVVYTTSRPYVAELDTSRMRDTCAWCFMRATSNDGQPSGSPSGIRVQPCSACRRVYYCSKTCQMKSWKREHKYECKALAPADRPDLPHGVRATLKLLGRLKADPEGKDDQLLDILQFQPFAEPELLRVVKESKPQRFEDFEALAYGSWMYAGQPKIGNMDSLTIAKGLFFNVGVLLMLGEIDPIMTNTFDVSAPYDDISLGMGFDPIVCSANHSCEPNAFVVFNQPTLLMRALRPIAADEEIFIKYVDPTNPRCIRQAELRETYYFTCACTKCSRPGNNEVEDRFEKPLGQLNPTFCKVADNLIQRHQPQLHRFAVQDNTEVSFQRLAALQAEAFSVSGTTFDYNKGNSSASEDEIRDALRLCLNSGMWSYSRQPVPHLLRQLLLAKIAYAQTYQAWRIAAKMHFLVSPTLHPCAFYPDRLVDIWTLATLTNELISPQNREPYQEILRGGLDLRLVFAGLLLELHEQIPYSYGRESPFGRMVEQVYQQFITSMKIPVEEVKLAVEQTWPKFEAVARSADVLGM